MAKLVIKKKNLCYCKCKSSENDKFLYLFTLTMTLWSLSANLKPTFPFLLLLSAHYHHSLALNNTRSSSFHTTDPAVHLVNRKPLFIFSPFQTLSSSSANSVSDPPHTHTSLHWWQQQSGSMTSFRRWQPYVRKLRQSSNIQTKEKARDREEGGKKGGQRDKNSSRNSVLARNVKQFSSARRLLS